MRHKRTQQKYAGEQLTPAEKNTVSEIVNLWRQRLSSISWFMRCLNQDIAFQANREDDCRGRFWQSRFTSQALKTKEALLTCMAYVDLNPIRANMADTLEKSEYTSIKERITPNFNLHEAIKQQTHQQTLRYFDSPLKPLLHFDATESDTEQTGIPFSFTDYLALVDWTGRAIRDDKRGAIDNSLPSILVRLNLSPKQ